MIEFLKSYGIGIVVGLFFTFMLWRSARGQGAGCCGGRHEHAPEAVKKDGEQGTGKNTACH